MKLLILTLCVAYAVADVSHILKQNNSPDSQAQILKQELDIDVDGRYQWAIETENGIAQHEHGQLKNVGREDEAQEAQGQVQWTAPNGEVINFEYIADENGYRPLGSHIPTPPPIPESILKALAYIEAHPPKE